MIKTGKKILFFILMLFFGINLSCERIEPDDNDGTGEELQTILNPDVKFLDHSDFKYIGVLEELLIFEVLDGSKIPLIGDVFFYYDEDEQIFGRIESLSNEAGIIRIGASPLCLNSLFDFMAVKSILNEMDIDSTYLDPRASMVSDTMIFEPIEQLWDFGGGNWGLMNLDTLRIFNRSGGYEQYFMGPVWEEGIATKRIDYELEHQYDLRANIRVLSTGNYSVMDSLMVREIKLGPYYADKLPIYFVIQEWLIISVDSEGDNSFEADFTAAGNSKLTPGYQLGKNWKVGAESTGMEDVVHEIVWNKKSAISLSISFETKFIPVFCGQADIEISSINTWSFESDVQWPNWGYSVNRDFAFLMKSGAALFCDLPAEKYSDSGIGRIIAEAGGQLVNSPPVPDFSINPTTGFTDTNFTFDAKNSYDKEDDASLLQVRWDFNGDGIWETNYSQTKQKDNYFSSPGNYTVILEVKDSQGLTAILPKTVNVEAVSSAPIASFTVAPEFGRVSDVFTFDASGSWDSEDDVSQLKVRWDYDGDDIWDTQFSTNKVAQWVFREPNIYFAKVDVKDTQGLSSTTTVEIVVEAINIKPTAIFTVSPEEGDINTFFNFDASGSSDVEDEASLLLVRWDFENDAVWDTEYRSIKTVSHRFPLANNYTVVLQVKDTDGYSTLFSLDVSVSNPNTVPIADFAISPATGDTTTVFTFDARITQDLEDSIEGLEFRWDWENTGTYDTEFSSSPIVEWTFETVGTKLIKMQVRDSGGLTDTKTKLITIQ